VINAYDGKVESQMVKLYGSFSEKDKRRYAAINELLLKALNDFTAGNPFV